MSEPRRSVVYVVTDLWPLADKINEVKKILSSIVPEAKKERTCLKYELCENINENAQMTYLQAWANEEALQNHLNSELIINASKELRDLLSKPTEIRRYRNIG